MKETCTPIKLHPENPHYFLFRGKPTILFTSGEHYSIVMNKHFDYIKYLDTLQSFGFNHTRVYTGVKRERPGEHSIDGNALAVLSDDFIGPWSRSDVPGAVDGGNKFDLDTFDEKYFLRFKEILKAASKRNIELEVIIYGPLHLGGDGVGPWGICPLNVENNINNVGNVQFQDALSMKDKRLVEYMDIYTRKLITELNEFDNLHYEICNEPYTYATRHVGEGVCMEFSDKCMRLEWQQHVADVVYETESLLPNRHLISCNYSAGFGEIYRPLRHVDLYCFHYINPEAIKRNYSLNKAIGMNETGIMKNAQYVRQCWKTVLSGLALYNMLDYTYTMGYEDGSYNPMQSSPAYTGITGNELRNGLKIVNDFINSFNFIEMKPAMELLKYDISINPEIYVFAEENEQYAVYQIDNQHSGYGYSCALGLKATEGRYKVEIIDTFTGRVIYEYETELEEGSIPVYWCSSKIYNENHEIEFAARITRIHK